MASTLSWFLLVFCRIIFVEFQDNWRKFYSYLSNSIDLSFDEYFFDSSIFISDDLASILKFPNPSWIYSS